MRSVDGAPATQWNTSGAALRRAVRRVRRRPLRRLQRLRPRDRRPARRATAGRSPRTGRGPAARASRRRRARRCSRTFEAGGVGNVYLVREGHATQSSPRAGTSAPSRSRPTRAATCSPRGTATARSSTGCGALGRLTPVKKLGTVTAAMHLSAVARRRPPRGRGVGRPARQRGRDEHAGADRRRRRARPRAASATPKVLETYPDLTVISGVGVRRRTPRAAAG